MASLPSSIKPAAVATGNPSVAELQARIAELEKQVSSKPARQFSVLVSAKGAISIYGLGRFPETLYWGQLDAILQRADELRKFAVANWTRLDHKPTDVKPDVTLTETEARELYCERKAPSLPK